MSVDAVVTMEFVCYRVGVDKAQKDDFSEENTKKDLSGSFAAWLQVVNMSSSNCVEHDDRNY